MTNNKDQANITFEKAFERLENILSILNENKVPLEQSIQLFEEADKLINLCDKFLSSSEQKIEQLIKNRENQLELDEEQKPITQSFRTFETNCKKDIS